MHRSIIPFLFIVVQLPFAVWADDCVDGPVPASGCAVKGTTGYVYPSQYNGKTTLGADVVTPDMSGVGAPTQILPEGYYSGNSVTWTSTSFDPANIVAGATVFGLAGTASATSPLGCASGLINSDTASTSKCTLSGSQSDYVYTAITGGRTQACVISDPGGTGFTGLPTPTPTATPTPTPGPSVTPTPTPTPTPPSTAAGNCWIQQPAGRTVRTDPSILDCAKSGLVANSCMVDQSYWYTQAYGGRSSVCVPGTTSTPCWLNVTAAYAGVSTTCSTGSNAASCLTGGNSYVYGQAYGGRAATCADDDQGYCWISTSGKSTLAANLTAANIRSGFTIFGVAGTYTGTAYTWGSGAHRIKNTSPNRITYTYETGLTASTQLPANYAPVPKISVSTDASIGSPQATQVTAVTRLMADGTTAWGLTNCGLSGTIAARIADCLSTMGPNATWDGTVNGNAGQYIWKLVSRDNFGTSAAYEVWQDQATKLHWSSLVSSSGGLSWCQASGNSNSSNVPASLQENDPSNICNNSLYQSTGAVNAVSACYRNTGTDGPGNFSDPKGYGLGTSNLYWFATAAQGKVMWRLPTTYDYILANHHGLRFVLPDMSTSGQEWTATVSAKNHANAWTFDAATGSRQTQRRSYSFSARCVGR